MIMWLSDLAASGCCLAQYWADQRFTPVLTVFTSITSLSTTTCPTHRDKHILETMENTLQLTPAPGIPPFDKNADNDESLLIVFLTDLNEDGKLNLYSTFKTRLNTPKSKPGVLPSLFYCRLQIRANIEIAKPTYMDLRLSHTARDGPDLSWQTDSRSGK